jgi:hypothetical protein
MIAEKSIAQVVAEAEPRQWPDGPVLCEECRSARANGDGAFYCMVFECVRLGERQRFCTAFRPIGWGKK